MYELVPSEFYLSQNYPNPFKEKTTIKYCVPDKTSVKMIVLDHDMKLIKELENEVKEAGTFEIEFYASKLPSGIYFYRLQADGYVETRKMVLLR